MESRNAEAAYGIDKIRRVPLREVWRHEALDFTTWLELNPDALSDILDITLENVERERAAGTFAVDLVAEDPSGDTVVIENQLEKSDHDHLGKLITYLAALDARAAIWIVSDPRPEHVGAITWLNESLAASFYLVKVEAIRIGESPAAPLLTLITGPSPETRKVGVQKQERVERHDLREAFWASLLERARERTRLHSGVSPNTDTWLSAGSGRSGVHFTYTIRGDQAGVQLGIEGESALRNQALFAALANARAQIEEAFGDALEWDQVEGRKRCLIRKTLMVGGYKAEEERWPEIQDALVDAMVRLEGALKPHVSRLPA